MDSEFGPATYNALLNAQRVEGIGVDGVYGSQSRSYLRWPSRTTSGNCAHGYTFGL
ncbi:peptidoglycan-binding domain-containing protein [Microbacterium rhizomatis]|uniref:peptidoglycan-binding domain-containing protein n=1 Tax=Microbacterium rhizomatis TaxID=1631477 RepID=UPI003CCCEBBB